MNHNGFLLASVLAATLGTTAAHAAPIASTSASSLATAQDVTAFFTTNALSNVQDSTTLAHVEIVQSGRASSGNDFYRFSHTGGTVHLDMDGPTNFDMEVGIWNMAGTLFAANDDNGGDLGSDSGLNSAIFGLSLAAGDYVVGVCQFSCSHSSSFVMTGSVVPTGGRYVLNISANALAVPEPASAALVLLALGGAGVATRRSKARNAQQA